MPWQEEPCLVVGRRAIIVHVRTVSTSLQDFQSMNDSYLTGSKPMLPSEANCASRQGKTRMAPDIRDVEREPTQASLASGRTNQGAGRLPGARTGYTASSVVGRWAKLARAQTVPGLDAPSARFKSAMGMPSANCHGCRDKNRERRHGGSLGPQCNHHHHLMEQSASLRLHCCFPTRLSTLAPDRPVAAVPRPHSNYPGHLDADL